MEWEVRGLVLSFGVGANKDTHLDLGPKVTLLYDLFSCTLGPGCIRRRWPWPLAHALPRYALVDALG